MTLAKKLPWTLSFVLDWWPHMNLSSVLRLREYELRNAKGRAIDDQVLTLKMRSPIQSEVTLREVGSDIHTFTEILREQVYGDLLSQVQECATVIDLGANIGLAALYIANHFPKCNLLAVEPHPGSHQVLKTNLKHLIAAGRCRTLRAAVWGKETILVGDHHDAPEHYSMFAMREPTVESSDESQTPGLSMPRIIAESGFETIDILKVDIEGAEVELFKGDVSWLSRVRSIAIEFHGDSRVVSDFDCLMQLHGFRVVDSGSHTVLALSNQSIHR